MWGGCTKRGLQRPVLLTVLLVPVSLSKAVGSGKVAPTGAFSGTVIWKRGCEKVGGLSLTSVMSTCTEMMWKKEPRSICTTARTCSNRSVTVTGQGHR